MLDLHDKFYGSDSSQDHWSLRNAK